VKPMNDNYDLSGGEASQVFAGEIPRAPRPQLGTQAAVSPGYSRGASRSLYHRLADFFTLTKPEVLFLVLITTAAGSIMASPGIDVVVLLDALIGTALIAGGTAALNHYIERRFDAEMRRTNRRPLPAGRMRPAEALVFGLCLSVAGTVYLALRTNLLTCAIGVGALLTYLLLYTPLKRRSDLCTFVGAFPGAAPILMGFTAVRGYVGPEGWVLYAILFIWQFPHFIAIGWIYRDDYSRAGMLMLPESDAAGDAAFLRMWVTSAALVVLSVLPIALGMAGPVYLAASAVLAVFLIVYVYRASASRTSASARGLLHATVIYLPLLLFAMVAGK
jgi:protoheme IX farnesyltransferase